MNNLKKIYVIKTNSYDRIYNDLYIKSFPKEIVEKLETKDLDNLDSVPGAVGSNDFKQINQMKMKFIYDKICDNINCQIIITDCDIVFFGGFYKTIEDMLIDKDFLFLNNGNGEYNVGFIIINCTEVVKRFWEESILPNIYKISNQFVSDQDFLNYFIRGSKTSHDYLPNKFWTNRVPYNVDGRYRTSEKDILDSIPKNSVIFHATAMDGGESVKYHILKKTIEYINENN